MSDSDIDDDFDNDFNADLEGDDDAKKAEETESEIATRGSISSLEKRRLIDNLLEEKRLARELKDGFDDDFDDDFDDIDELDD